MKVFQMTRSNTDLPIHWNLHKAKRKQVCPPGYKRHFYCDAIFCSDLRNLPKRNS